MNKNKKAQVSMWGFIYGVIGLVIALVITKMMNPGIFWSIVTIVVTTGGAYFVGAKASGDF